MEEEKENQKKDKEIYNSIEISTPILPIVPKMEQGEGGCSKNGTSELLKWFNNNWALIFICLIAIGTLLYVGNNIDDIQRQCNDHYAQQLERCGCNQYNTFVSNISFDVPFVTKAGVV